MEASRFAPSWRESIELIGGVADKRHSAILSALLPKEGNRDVPLRDSLSAWGRDRIQCSSQVKWMRRLRPVFGVELMPLSALGRIRWFPIMWAVVLAVDFSAWPMPGSAADERGKPGTV